MRTIGIMGGTFDPIHLGHLQIALSARDQLALDEVLFLPDGDPPHKEPVSLPQDRLNMVRLACQGEPRFMVSDMELARRGRTYTVDTLVHLKELRPGDDFFYLVGSDTFFLFPTWKTAHKVARLCHMAVLMRPGDNAHEVRALQEDYLERFGLISHLMGGIGLNLSSSAVRDGARRGEDITGMVPRAVAHYITTHGLYQKPLLEDI